MRCVSPTFLLLEASCSTFWARSWVGEEKPWENRLLLSGFPSIPSLDHSTASMARAPTVGTTAAAQQGGKKSKAGKQQGTDAATGKAAGGELSKAQKKKAAKRAKKAAHASWCWYCDREFQDDKVLLSHQKSKHFRCPHCPRRLNTAGGLAVHIDQVHKVPTDR